MTVVSSIQRRGGNFTAAVANASNITVLTPLAGTRYRLRTLIISGSIAGRYQVFDNSSGNPLIYDGALAANSPLTITVPGEGYVGATTGVTATVTLVNQSGSASDLGATAFYELLTP